MRRTAGLAFAWTLLAAGCGTTTQIPEIDTTGMEPQVVARIEERVRALRDEPSAESWGTLGDALLAHGLDDDAVGCYVRAAESGEDPFEWTYLAAVVTGSPSLFAEAAALRPDEPLVPLREGLARQQGEDHEAAIAAFRAALRLDDDLQRAHRGLGQELLAAGDPSGAIAALERAVALAPDDAAAGSALAAALLAVGREDDARAAAARARRGRARAGFSDPIWRRHVVENGVSTARRFERARLQIADGDWEAARATIDALLASRPREADAHFLSGVVYAAQGGAAAAAAAYGAALEIDPRHVRALLEWAALDERRGDYDAARGRIERALALSPRDPSIAFALARNRRAANDPAGLVEALDRLIAFQPDMPELLQLRREAAALSDD